MRKKMDEVEGWLKGGCLQCRGSSRVMIRRENVYNTEVQVLNNTSNKEDPQSTEINVGDN